MRSIDIFSFILSVLGIYSLILSFRYLLPRNATLLIAALLGETQQLLDRTESMGDIPLQSEFRIQLDQIANQFAMMRVQSHRARGAFQQLHLAFLRGLTCKLYSLYYRVEAIKAKLELTVDEQRLATREGAANTVVPSPIAVPPATATLVYNTTGPTLPLPATTSRMSIVTSD